MILHIEQWIALLPIMITAGTSVLVMLGIAVRRHHRANATLSVIGLNAALLSMIWVVDVIPQGVTPLFIVDGYAVFYMSLILVTSLGVATLMHAYIEGYAGHQEEIYVLLVIATLGAMVLACSRHFATFFLGLELLSIPLFAMIAYPIREKHALEGGVKYLILSAAASAFLLFGMALIYAQAGTLSYAGLARVLDGPQAFSVYVLVGSAMFLVGAGFKLSLVPFHLWTPDVYEGAPAPVTAFLATVSKAAVFCALLRYVAEGAGASYGALLDVLSAIAILSILVGNVLALMQNNVKRLLAYSSIAHFGYLLVALIASGPLAVEAVGVYLLTYVVTTLGAFGVVTLMSSPMHDRDADLIANYRGLFWRRPYLSAILTAMLLSLAGIPVTAGFIGKFYIVAAGIDARLWWLLGAVVLGSAIGLYYYLRVMIALYLVEPGMRRVVAAPDWAQRAGGVMVLALMLVMLLMGLYPEPFVQLVQASALSPP